ncbi:MAG TPA: hypothetical protein DCE23_09270 [Firmicutes bacterium]|nr:hypothetical protein [Bacillota bacterium]
MTFKDKLKIAIPFYRKSRKKIMYSIIMIICALIALTILTVNTNYKTMQKTIMSSSSYRTLFVTPPEGEENLTDELKQKISKMNHIVDVYDSYPWIEVNIDIDGEMKRVILNRLTASDLPPLIYGEKYKDTDSNSIVCPNPLYTLDSLDNIDSSDVYNLKNMLGKEIDMSYYDYKLIPGSLGWDFKQAENEQHHEKIKIVGLYKNGLVYNEGGCFINTTDFERIRNISQSKVLQARKEQDGGINSFRVVVDKVENIDKVIDELAKNGMENTSPEIELDKKLYTTFFTITSILLSLSIFTVIIITLSYAKKKILSEQKNIAVMLTEGFTKKILVTYILYLHLSKILFFTS